MGADPQRGRTCKVVGKIISIVCMFLLNYAGSPLTPSSLQAERHSHPAEPFITCRTEGYACTRGVQYVWLFDNPKLIHFAIKTPSSFVISRRGESFRFPVHDPITKPQIASRERGRGHSEGGLCSCDKTTAYPASQYLSRWKPPPHPPVSPVSPPGGRIGVGDVS